MTSLCFKNEALQSKVSSLSKEVETLKDKDEKSKIIRNSKTESKTLQAQVDNLNATVLKFTNSQKWLNFLLSQPKRTLNTELNMIKIVKLYC